jgi:hypothetical protein
VLRNSDDLRLRYAVDELGWIWQAASLLLF